MLNDKPTDQPTDQQTLSHIEMLSQLKIEGIWEKAFWFIYASFGHFSAKTGKRMIIYLKEEEKFALYKCAYRSKNEKMKRQRNLQGHSYPSKSLRIYKYFFYNNL